MNNKMKLLSVNPWNLLKNAIGICLILLRVSVAQEAFAQPCSQNYVTDPDELETTVGPGCSGTTTIDEIFDANPIFGSGYYDITGRSGKVWDFKMISGCQNPVNSYSHKGTFEMIGPYAAFLGNGSWCYNTVKVDYDAGASWIDNVSGGNIVIHTGGLDNDDCVYDGCDDATVLEIKNIRTPSMQDGVILLSYGEVNGVPVMEGTYGNWHWWQWQNHGKVILYQEGCNNPNAFNYEPGKIWGPCDLQGTAEYGTCNNPHACNYNNSNGLEGVECDYESCDCDDENACNYNSVTTTSNPVNTGQTVVCEFTSCDCNNPSACNYANGNGKAGEDCIWTGRLSGAWAVQNNVNNQWCDCQNENACNYANGNGTDGLDCIFTGTLTGDWAENQNIDGDDCDCQAPDACNYENGLGQNGLDCVYATDYPSGLCSGGCILQQPYVQVTVESEAVEGETSSSTVTLTLKHEVDAVDQEAVNYSNYLFQGRLEGGDWRDVTWQQRPTGLVSSTTTWVGTIDFSDCIVSCHANVEFREAGSMECSQKSFGASNDGEQGALFPVTFSVPGCSDPEACNFVSNCASDDDSCLYPIEYWSKDDDGNYIAFQGHYCPGDAEVPSGFPKVCEQAEFGEEDLEFFTIDHLSQVGNHEKTILSGSEHCEFQSSQRIVSTSVQRSNLPTYVPVQDLLTFLDIAHNQTSLKDIGAGRKIQETGTSVGSEVVLVKDRYDNEGKAFRFNGQNGLAFFNNEWATCLDRIKPWR